MVTINIRVSSTQQFNLEITDHSVTYTIDSDVNTETLTLRKWYDNMENFDNTIQNAVRTNLQENPVIQQAVWLDGQTTVLTLSNCICRYSLNSELNEENNGYMETISFVSPSPVLGLSDNAVLEE